ncbi:protein containing Six-hairpin glycosidase-like domain [Methylotuvimicrobium buryatense]|uniref:Protein containing Six-hairpin glycosidase-like domain protein n=1 Tax=Methylotuvimicrobium buryatense TaxID=95641 RepID=A0A4P9US84_METBY|nr:protein containing Six-hairpin glycosidase-like domain [Methylotuvimicrobium buryatense]QCW84287.1 protein containing Six-hairpin glycosidase-like domain protein [Methylotuvimicrobium buryatense]
MADQNRAFHSKTDFSAEHRLLKDIRQALISGESAFSTTDLDLPFDPVISQIYISLFQRGLKPIRWGARRATIEATLQRIVEKLKTNPALSDFAVQDANQCRILFEMVTEERPCPLKSLTGSTFCDSRFEPGITGIKYEYKGVLRYFMPTDAVVHSIMSVSQLLRFLAKKTGIAKQSNRFSVREKLMRSEPISSSLIKSIAFISYTDREILPLYRGYPISKVRFDKETLLESTLKSIDWLVANMYDDGSFLYFYDAYQDTKVDFDHPKMADPLYNNILRHCGGTISLLRGYELTGRNDYLEAAGHSMQYLFSTLREHEWQGRYACYPFDNKKSKLGGAGVALVALMHYYRHTGDEAYRLTIDGLVRHILSRIADDGEMIGYYIHPLFNQGQPIIDPPDDIKRQLFSFYYPGEALLGLALYYQWIDRIDDDLKKEVAEKSEKALDFLVDIRPVKYKELFLELPADAWLMQAIEEWVKVEGFRKNSYIDFVFNDADAMIEHSYTDENSPYLDYAGGFYYYYGDHVYHDGSRCEGLIAAYYLSTYLGEQKRADKIMAAMIASAKGLMYTRHTAESTYAHLYPEKSINSFRFKLTRQWVRVDSVQHTACFYSRLYFVM